MKFRKEIYKRAIGKIEKKQNKEENLHINQKYKEKILNNELDDSLEGINGSDYVYDIDMLKKGTVRRIICRGILMFAGIILCVLAFCFTYDNIKTRISGQKIRLEYTEKSKYLKRRNEKAAGYKYDGYILLIMDESEQAKQENKQELTNEGNSLTRYVNIWKIYYAQYHSGMMFKDGLLDGQGPTKIYLMVYSELPFICDYSAKKYVNVYYNPDKGEDYRNARVLYSIWLYVVMDILVILYMVFATRLFIKEIKYEQTLRKRERLE